MLRIEKKKKQKTIKAILNTSCYFFFLSFCYFSCFNFYCSYINVVFFVVVCAHVFHDIDSVWFLLVNILIIKKLHVYQSCELSYIAIQRDIVSKVLKCQNQICTLTTIVNLNKLSLSVLLMQYIFLNYSECETLFEMSLHI